MIAEKNGAEHTRLNLSWHSDRTLRRVLTEDEIAVVEGK